MSRKWDETTAAKDALRRRLDEQKQRGRTADKGYGTKVRELNMWASSAQAMHPVLSVGVLDRAVEDWKVRSGRFVGRLFGKECEGGGGGKGKGREEKC